MDFKKSSASYLVERCQLLLKKKLEDYDVEDLRIMITQQIGIDYLIPLAIDELEKNVLAEGDYYEGDLLLAVLSVNKNFWRSNPRIWLRMSQILRDNGDLLKTEITDKKVYKDFSNL